MKISNVLLVKDKEGIYLYGGVGNSIHQYMFNISSGHGWGTPSDSGKTVFLCYI
jgi:hypothetical protein